MTDKKQDKKEENPNLVIWDALSETNPKFTKNFKRAGGFSGTAINPTYQMKLLTAAFGPIGIGWYYDVIENQTFAGPKGELVIYREIALYVKRGTDWSKPIRGLGGDFIISSSQYGLRVDDEAFKKAETDALGNAMKKLGISADIHMGMYDDNKYLNDLKAKFGDAEDGKKEELPTRAQSIFEQDFLYYLGECNTAAEIISLVDEYEKDLRDTHPIIAERLTQQIDQAKRQREQGITPSIQTYRFKDVEHAVEFAQAAHAKINKAENPQVLSEWVLRNDTKLKALNTALSAKKYNTDKDGNEMPPIYNRVVTAYNNKIKQLQENMALDGSFKQKMEE